MIIFLESMKIQFPRLFLHISYYNMQQNCFYRLFLQSASGIKSVTFISKSDITPLPATESNLKSFHFTSNKIKLRLTLRKGEENLFFTLSSHIKQRFTLDI